MLKTLRYTTSLAWDLGEALLAAFNCNPATDRMWARAKADYRDESYRIAEEMLAAAEAEKDVMEPECHCWADGLAYHALDCHLWYGTDSSSVGVGPQPPTGERPPALPANLVEPEGTPELTFCELAAVAGAVRGYANREITRDPEYWSGIADRLSAVVKAEVQRK